MKIKESQLKEIIKNTLMESYGSCAWNGMPVGPKKKKKLTKGQKRARQESEEARENKNHEREMFNLMKKITESQLREIIKEAIINMNTNPLKTAYDSIFENDFGTLHSMIYALKIIAEELQNNPYNFQNHRLAQDISHKAWSALDDFYDYFCIEESQKQALKNTLIKTEEYLNEKAVSKSQQRFMGMVHAVQKGELDADEVGDSVAKAAKSMKKKDVKDFAETKHKGLPNHVDESVNRNLEKIIKEAISEVSKAELDREWDKEAIKDTYNNAKQHEYTTDDEDDLFRTDWEPFYTDDEPYGMIEFKGNDDEYHTVGAEDTMMDDDDNFDLVDNEDDLEIDNVKLDDIDNETLANHAKDLKKDFKQQTTDFMYDRFGNKNVNENKSRAKVNESQLRNIIRESIKKVLNERNNRPFPEYAKEYQEKHGEKLPDEQLKDAAKKNDERFHKRNNH